MTDNKTTPNERDRELRRREWLRIYLPVLLGAVLATAMIVVIASIGLKGENLATDPASVWGDAAAIIVALQVGVICLVVLVLIGALCALLIWLIVKLDPLLRRGQEITERVNYRVDLVANRVVERLIKMNSLGARVRGIRQLWWR
ncbi:MAG: hypothetical protein GQ526_00675 [Ardenticatenales bacterium]|nr:hypothetical protein [Ardenticatenales bacterium]